MLLYPDLDPVALRLGPLAIRWYGLMYLAAFLIAHQLAKRRWRGAPEALDDLLFCGFLGIVIGGRLGEVLFYAPGYYFLHPQEIIKVWNGGMSFHGGFLGLLVALWVWARKYRQDWLATTDFIAPLAPIGLMLGRIGNFINGEIWGRVADPALPWAMIFPHVDALPRHPVQLYHASLEGLTLFLLLWFYSGKQRPRGALSGCFLLGYGFFRSFTELFREPDPGIFGFSYTVSMGQWLSLPMLLAGAVLLAFAFRKQGQKSKDRSQ
ncbi:MAG: prolipoprotein diacylglyceryl transferase [Zoogloeaceae bacterium]|jgi:phosphatidylglycerol:prolipoprotein diacylglycerol transferase|nr:prolipoprotein diacylglyceryl transferase [Zoogloeaceae bacterium]